MDSPKSLSPKSDRRQSVYHAVNSYQKKERAWNETPLNAHLVSEDNTRLSSVLCLIADDQVMDFPYGSPFMSCLKIGIQAFFCYHDLITCESRTIFIQDKGLKFLLTRNHTLLNYSITLLTAGCHLYLFPYRGTLKLYIGYLNGR